MSSPNPNLVNLFDCKPQTLTWAFECKHNSSNYDGEVYTSPCFGDPHSNFCLKLFTDSKIRFPCGKHNNPTHASYYYSDLNRSRPVIFLNHNFTHHLKVTAFARISILNAKGEKCNTQEGRVNFVEGKTTSGGVFHFDFIDLKYIKIDNKLTIYCEVYVLNEQTISSGFNGDSVLALLKDQKELLKSGKFSDFVISVDGKEFKVHKNILAVRSPVFAVMFEHTDTKEALEGRVEIENVKSELFEQFLLYLYTGKVSLLEECAEELLKLAEKYQIDSLKSLCSQQLSSSLTTDSVGKLLCLADQYRSEELKSNCVQFIKQFPDKIDWDALTLAVVNCSSELCFELFKYSITKK